MKRLVTALAVVLLATGLASAQPPEHPRGPLFQRLNLSQEQQDQMQKLRSDFQKKQVQDQAKVRTAEIELRDLLRADNPDRKSIANKVKDLASFREQAQMDRIDHLLAVRALLTPEQQRLWKSEMMNEGAAGVGMRRHMRGAGMGAGPMGQTPEERPDTGK